MANPTPFPSAGGSQPPSTISNQRQIPILGEARQPSLVPCDLIGRCADEHEAVLLCVHLSKLSNETICGALGIDKGHWSRMMQGRASLPSRKRLELMRLCGNLAPIQFEAMQAGLTVFVDAKALRKSELLAELAQLEAA